MTDLHFIGPEGRYDAHQVLEKKFRTSAETRGYQWSMHQPSSADEPNITVRLADAPIPIFPIDSEITFSIHAVPVRRSGKTNHRNATVLYLTEYRDRKQWLKRAMAEHAGVQVEYSSIRLENECISTLRKGDARFAMPSCNFVGSGKVFDPEKLQQALRNGIGKGRAYGFGMLFVKGK